MSLKIDSGLFKFDFTDHHAVLGVPVDADITQIRKRYLQVARRLHPDSCSAANATEKQLASQLLSKLVNPAYEKFSKDRNYAEYGVLLREMSKRLVQESNAIELTSDLSKQLSQTSNIDYFYKTSLHKLAEQQYETLAEVLQMIAQISELNLVYLMRKGGSVLQPPTPTQVAASSLARKTQATPPSPPETVIDQYIRRAQILIEKNNFPQARVELQDALKLEPNNSRCHSLMGVVYLKQNQLTMAKVHVNKALQLNPQEPMALKCKQLLEQLGQKVGTQPTTTSKSTQSKPDKSGGGSMFGGLFGGKKK